MVLDPSGSILQLMSVNPDFLGLVPKPSELDSPSLSGPRTIAGFTCDNQVTTATRCTYDCRSTSVVTMNVYLMNTVAQPVSFHLDLTSTCCILHESQSMKSLATRPC